MTNLAYDAVVFLLYLGVLLYCMREGYDDYPRLWTAIGAVTVILIVLFVAKVAKAI